MPSYNDLISKRNQTAEQLLDHLSKKIAAGANATVISELALAFRYLDGGPQPGSAAPGE
ncbi:hypothetical protein [Curtobacterium sp. MCLR17_058]|uniref:hypothetical protein n=1 Tax=Curtobacterium sp. MCLR17_058 TaxID=2175635 RepID=UPI0015E897BB|nr:hypothetical protein [Curtobacterium sp. MCLR17_058]WIB42702.1 hypothetical protein DEJ11_17990 [Curtobacterium sp. MCLR17_058]